MKRRRSYLSKIIFTLFIFILLPKDYIHVNARCIPGPTGSNGGTGATGASGINGVNAGIKYVYNGLTFTGNPSSGQFGFNHANLAIITNFRISQTNYLGNNIAALMNTWSQSMSPIRSIISIVQDANPSSFIDFEIISAFVNNTGLWNSYTAVYLSSSGTFTTGVLCNLFYSNTGAQGLAGLSYSYSTSASTHNQGSGVMWFNHLINTAFSNINLMYLNALDAFGNSQAGIQGTWSTSTSAIRSVVTMTVVASPTNTASFEITGIPTNGTSGCCYNVFPVIPLSLSGTFTTRDAVSVTWANTGYVGPTGPTGPIGATGANAGIPYFYTNSIAATNPGTGFFGFNHAVGSSITSFRISQTNAYGNNIQALMASWTQSMSPVRSILTIRQDSNTGNTVNFEITSAYVNTSTGWNTFTIAYLSNTGSFSNGIYCQLYFSNTGQQGLSAGLYYTLSTSTSAVNQGAGTVWFNANINTHFSTVTGIYINSIDAFGNSQTGIQSTWSVSTSTIRSILTIQQSQLPTNMVSFEITGASTNMTSSCCYTLLSVTPLQSTGTFVSGVPVSISWANTGSVGPSSGLEYTYSSSIAMTGNPGLGTFRLNKNPNTAFSALSEFSINTYDMNNHYLYPLLQTWSLSSSSIRSIITIQQDQVPTNFMTFEITGAYTNGTGTCCYLLFPVTPLTFTGTFTNGFITRISYAVTGIGQIGATGAAGATGVQGIPGPKGGINSTFLFSYTPNVQTNAITFVTTNVIVNSVTMTSTGVYACFWDGTYDAPGSITSAVYVSVSIYYNSILQDSSTRRFRGMVANGYYTLATSATVTVTNSSIPILTTIISSTDTFTMENRALRCFRVS